VPAQQIAQNLAYINWVVLTGLGIGSFVAVVFARARTEAPRGYLAFTALCAAAFAALAWLSDGALATAATIAHAARDPLTDQVRAFGLAVLAASAVIWAIGVRRGSRMQAVGAIGLVASAVTLVTAAIGWSNSLISGLPLLVQLVVLSAATGGVFAAMILGHWYLVTPKLGEQPLVLLSRVLLWIVALQLALFFAWAATGTGNTTAPGAAGGTGPFGALTGPWALFVWLRLIVGLVFPLIVSWAALQTAKSRSMESATGLLYINVGAIAAGTILASGLYFGAGLLT
jgi:hypothetical protein